MPAPNTTLSHDPATEEALLGCCLLSESIASAAATKLREDDFGDEDHRGLFQLISEASREGAPTDAVSIRNRLNGQALHFQRDPRVLMAGMVATVPKPSSGLFYIETLVDLRERRELDRAGDWLKREADGTNPHAAKAAAALLLSDDGANAPESTQPWPVMRPEAYDGLAGEVVAALSSETEADETGLLMTFLTQFGCMTGPNPHIMLSGREHPAKLFAVLIGETGRARKGAADSMISWLMKQVDPDFVMDRHETMPNSGEALVHQVRDPHLTDPGIEDKRLYVIDEEFASGLERMHRQGNSISGTIRDAWDSKPLGGKSKQNPSTTKRSHICIMGHATMSELEGKLSSSDVSNGFANRFLYTAVRSTKLLPFGGTMDSDELKKLPSRIRRVIEDGSERRQLRFAEKCLKQWPSIYREIRESIPAEGPLVGYLGRGDTYIQRIALMYALLDQSELIEWHHMESALAVWAYSRASVEYMLATTTPAPMGTDNDLSQLVDLLSRKDRATGAQVRRELGWSGQRLAVTRARGVRSRLVVEEEFKGSRGGSPAKTMRLA